MYSLAGKIGSAVYRRSTQNRMVVLTYHRVLDKPDPIFHNEVHLEQFRKQVRALRNAFNVLPLGRAIALQEKGQLPPRTVCITFDDGYEDNYRNALPVLNEHGLKATFFIATGYLGNGAMWNDRIIHGIRHYEGDRLDIEELQMNDLATATHEDKRKTIGQVVAKLKYLPQKKREVMTQSVVKNLSNIPSQMMTTDQVVAMRQSGMEIGAHTVSHPILACEDEGSAREEILGSKEFLETLLGEKVTLFAYPNGKPEKDYLNAHVNILKEVGFSAAVSTRWGSAGADDNRFELPRIAPWDRSVGSYLLRILRSY